MSLVNDGSVERFQGFNALTSNRLVDSRIIAISAWCAPRPLPARPLQDLLRLTVAQRKALLLEEAVFGVLGASALAGIVVAFL